MNTASPSNEVRLPNKMLIKDIRYLLTMTGEPLDHSIGSSIFVEGKKIAGIYPAGSDLPQVEYVIDASHHLVMPGLVNCHHHFYQTLTRNLPNAANAKLFDWLSYLYDFWAAMTPEAEKRRHGTNKGHPFLFGGGG